MILATLMLLLQTGSNFGVFRFFSVFRVHVLILADLHQIHQISTKNLSPKLIIITKSLQMESLKMLPRKCWMVWSLIQMKKS